MTIDEALNTIGYYLRLDATIPSQWRGVLDIDVRDNMPNPYEGVRIYAYDCRQLSEAFAVIADEFLTPNKLEKES